MRPVSVVIPVRDDPLLENALTSVPFDVELIIAMTMPTECIRRVAEQFKSVHPNVIVCETSTRGMAAGVNLGVKAASNERIIMLDSDCTLNSNTIDAYMRALEKWPFVRGRTFVHRGNGWARFAGLGTESMNKIFEQRVRLLGPSIAFLKTPFLELGGYDENCGASCDHEFVLRMEDRGLATYFEPDAVIWHKPMTFRIDCRSHLGYGISMRYIDRKRGGWYGLNTCLMRWYPSQLWNKLRQRGVTSVFRSLLLGTIMLYGYIKSIYREKRSP